MFRTQLSSLKRNQFNFSRLRWGSPNSRVIKGPFGFCLLGNGDCIEGENSSDGMYIWRICVHP